MEQYIQITKLNDFLFCPMSLYFHSLYENYDQKLYHDRPQTVGKIKHENIDEGRYSSSSRYLQGLPVYSEKYGLMGKIDIYDKEEKTLIERKYKVNKIYDGYRYQLYAQKLCLEEMEFEVKKMFIHSLSDNKRYLVEEPTTDEFKKFEEMIKDIRFFDLNNYEGCINENKCDNCIYSPLCNKKI